MKAFLNITLLSLLFGMGEEANGENPFLSPLPQLFQMVDSETDEHLHVHPDISGNPYFPKGQESFYTMYLAAMKEPSLMVQRSVGSAFELRFTWLRSFHDKIAIRIWIENESRYVRAVKIALNLPDLSIGKVIHDVTRKLTDAEWEQVVAFGRQSEIWNPLNNEERIAVWPGFDGAQWIFEKREGFKYHMLDLCCPRNYSPERFEESGLDVSKIRDFSKHVDLGLFLLNVAELTPDDDEEIY